MRDLVFFGFAASVRALAPASTCEDLVSVLLGANTSVLSATLSSTKDEAVTYCLVKVLVEPSTNIWVGLPSDGSYNGRFMALGCGGFCGSVEAPEEAVKLGYAGAETDTGHVGGDGKFGMLSPGVPNTEGQLDYSHRSMHAVAAVGKQLIELFYGSAPAFSYFNGCSTGGRQAAMMAQKYPDDFQGILAGAPAIHFAPLGLGQLWPQVPMLVENGKPVEAAKQKLVVAAAVAACDALDGVVDQELRDPRACHYDATELLCPDGTDKQSCLTASEAAAINRIWDGPIDATGLAMWYGLTRDAPLGTLAGRKPVFIPVAEAKYWVYYNESWDYTTLNYQNWQDHFDKSVIETAPKIATDTADLQPFRDAGHKLLLWHGWSDSIIQPQGTVDYYNAVNDFTSEGDMSKTQDFARLYMAPGTGHCELDDNLFFDALVSWVENGTAPERLIVSKGERTRPLCPHPEVAIYTGTGSTDDEESFTCGPNPLGADTERFNRKNNERLFGKPFLPPPASDSEAPISGSFIV